MKKLYTVTDLGTGDGGKGAVVHKLCCLHSPHTVVKVGGAQGSHGIRTDDGVAFSFSQFGCGSLLGIPTHIAQGFVSSPMGVVCEAHALRYELGVTDPWSLLTVHRNVLCATPFHGILSRLSELARKNQRRGTIGTGVGTAMLEAEAFPQEAIRFADLVSGEFREKLRSIRLRSINEADCILEGGFLEDDIGEVVKNVELLRSYHFAVWVEERFLEASQHVSVVDDDYFGSRVLNREGNVVVESSHGVLTDRFMGFHPHVSRLRTLPTVTTWNMLESFGYDGQVIKLGVVRAYQMRHGAGPMATEGKAGAHLLPTLASENKRIDRYRGICRIGALDCVLLRYAINACGGPQVFDGVAITWLDALMEGGVWNVCTHYKEASDVYFRDGEIEVRYGDDSIHCSRQEHLGSVLGLCVPHVEQMCLPFGATKDDVGGMCNDIFLREIGVPVCLGGFGPRPVDMECW